jgi:hypothetical protein
MVSNESRVLALFEEANPVPDERYIEGTDIETAAYLATLKQRSSEVTQPNTEVENPAKSRKSWAWAAAVAVLVVITGVIAVLTNSANEKPPVIDDPPTATTVTIVPSTTSTVAVGGLDLSSSQWVTHGDGIRLDDGTRIWATAPFPAGVARDRQGGLVFTDSSGLWWFQSGSTEPVLVREMAAAELVSVLPSSDGPVVLVTDPSPRLLRLSDGEPVDVETDTHVEPVSETIWRWTAANGLSAEVTVPEVEWDAEGQPLDVLEPAHLIVSRGEEVLVDVTVGSVSEAWARIHDFDGRTVIVSRGPYEPAMPEETFLLIDLAEGVVADSFTAGGTTATLTGADVEWDGPVVAPELGE